MSGKAVEVHDDGSTSYTFRLDVSCQFSFDPNAFAILQEQIEAMKQPRPVAPRVDRAITFRRR